MNSASELTPAQSAVDERCLVLRYDSKVHCWIDKEGQAWTVSGTKDLVDATRDATGLTACSFCGEDLETDARRRVHMLNECPEMP